MCCALSDASVSHGNPHGSASRDLARLGGGCAQMAGYACVDRSCNDLGRGGAATSKRQKFSTCAPRNPAPLRYVTTRCRRVLWLVGVPNAHAIAIRMQYKYSYHALLGPQWDAIVRSCKYSADQGFSFSTANCNSIVCFRRYGGGIWQISVLMSSGNLLPPSRSLSFHQGPIR